MHQEVHEWYFHFFNLCIWMTKCNIEKKKTHSHLSSFKYLSMFIWNKPYNRSNSNLGTVEKYVCQMFVKSARVMVITAQVIFTCSFTINDEMVLWKGKVQNCWNHKLWLNILTCFSCLWFSCKHLKEVLIFFGVRNLHLYWRIHVHGGKNAVSSSNSPNDLPPAFARISQTCPKCSEARKSSLVVLL